MFAIALMSIVGVPFAWVFTCAAHTHTHVGVRLRKT